MDIFCEVKLDDIVKNISKKFDYNFSGISKFETFEIPEGIPNFFNIGVIFGASGTGKTLLLNKFGKEKEVIWDNEMSIASNFNSEADAINSLSMVGLNSIPSWCKPYSVLSNGEKFRADLSKKIEDNAVIDEFTSVVDRNVAKACSYSVSKYIRKKQIKNVIFATCHEDVLEWLEPDWIFNTNNGELLVGRYLQRPKINIEIYPCKYEVWRMFEKHHYMSSKLNKSSVKYMATWDDKVVGFSSAIAFPSGSIKNGYREHRTVVLPDYQGIGIGTRLSDAIAQIFIEKGKRYFSRTAHPRMGEYRNNSNLWKPTSKNMLVRNDIKNKDTYNGWINDDRLTYSHEYIGK